MSDSWQVVGQRQSSVRSSAGVFEDAMIVSYKTASGVVGQITVPLSQYTPQNVHDLIDAQASQVESVSSLSSSAPPPPPPSSASSS